jgi:hypothetical protein
MVEMTQDTGSGSSAHADEGISRRQLLSKAAIVAAGAAAMGLAAPVSQAVATAGDHLVVGTTVTAGASDVTGVARTGDGNLAASFVTPSGCGVAADSDAWCAVLGYGRNSTAIGVVAQNDEGGVALSVDGPVVFSKSGTVTISKGRASKTVTIPGWSGAPVSVRPGAMIFATLQGSAGTGRYIAWAKRTGNTTLKIQLNAAAKKAVKVAWFVLG